MYVHVANIVWHTFLMVDVPATSRQYLLSSRIAIYFYQRFQRLISWGIVFFQYEYIGLHDGLTNSSKSKQFIWKWSLEITLHIYQFLGDDFWNVLILGLYTQNRRFAKHANSCVCSWILSPIPTSKSLFTYDILDTVYIYVDRERPSLSDADVWYW